jgi:hypothetical protein
MKIQHIHHDNNGQLAGTLVAITDEAKGVVKVGFSVVKDGDIGNKKDGVELARRRALFKRNLKVPKKIERPFREFVAHIATRNEFEGFHVPLPDDFDYTLEPLHQHRH